MISRLHPTVQAQLSLEGMVKMIIGYLAVSLYLIPVLMGAEYTYYRIQSTTANVEYYSVEPGQQSYLAGAPLYFISDMEIKNEASLIFNDRLFCSEDGKEYSIVSMYNSSNDYASPAPRGKNRWIYNAHVPEANVLCYLSSQITDKRPYGILKKQMMRSAIFSIVKP